MTREEGYYWVKKFGTWEVAEWNPSLKWWYSCANEHFLEDHDFREINETRILPPDSIHTGAQTGLMP